MNNSNLTRKKGNQCPKYYFDIQNGKQRSPGGVTSRSRSQPLTTGESEKVTQINVYIANKQMHDKQCD